MNTYEEKKAARIERLRERAEKHDQIAADNGLDIFSEEKSGIPLGQPILVGHHSEGRHRRQLARMEKRVEKGFKSAETARNLRSRADAAESRTAIDTDNPEARQLILRKIAKLESSRDMLKAINKLVRKYKTPKTLAPEIARHFPKVADPEQTAIDMLTPDFAGRVGVPAYRLTNMGAEIRRLKQRLEGLAVVEQGFESFEVNGILVELVDGQLQVDFPWKPNEDTRWRLKKGPLVLKWSRYSERWVRKYTVNVASKYFMDTLREVLREAKQ